MEHDSMTTYNFDDLSYAAKQAAFNNLADIDYDWWLDIYDIIETGLSGFRGVVCAFDVEDQALHLNQLETDYAFLGNAVTLPGLSYRENGRLKRLIKNQVYCTGRNGRQDSTLEVNALHSYIEDDPLFPLAKAYLISSYENFKLECIDLLQSEYERLTSEECIRSIIEAKGYHFLENGDIA